MKIEYRGKHNVDIYCGDAVDVLKAMPSESVHCCITSPPYYGLRDYGVVSQIGREQTTEEYIERLVSVFREVRRVLTPDGTLWLNIGDSYAGSGKGRNADGTHSPGGKQATNKGSVGGVLHKTHEPHLKPKDLIGIPWKLAFALRDDGWYLRSEIIWHKPNPMPESVKDRPTKAHEQIFLLSKSAQYYYDYTAILEDAKWDRWGDQTVIKQQQGTASWIKARPKSDLQKLGKKNKRSVWTITPKPFAGAHFAVFPPELPRTCMLAGCPEGGVVLDVFSGAATTGIVAVQNGRSYIGIELNSDYVEISKRRLEQECGVECSRSKVAAEPSLGTASRQANLFSVSEGKRSYEEFRERLLTLAATELAA